MTESLQALLNPSLPGAGTKLLQSRVFSLGLCKAGNALVGVLPPGQELHVGGTRFGHFSLDRGSAAEAEMGKRADGLVGYEPAVLQYLREFAGRFCPTARGQVCVPANVDRIETQRKRACGRKSEIIGMLACS
jgi:hypothetical protein